MRAVIDFLCEVTSLICFCIWATLEAIYKLIIPQKGKSLNGEVAIVTGAGHGIGKELCFQLSKDGAKVVCWDINEVTAEETASEIRNQGGQAWSFKCDVSDKVEVADAAKKTRDAVGDIGMLFNNAGIMPCKPFHQHSATDIEKVFRVNTFSHFWTVDEFLPDFIRQKRGHIVCLSSIAGIVGTSNLTAYCATKYALRGFMDALYLEIQEQHGESGVNLTVVHPFTVNTGLAQNPRTRFRNLFPFSNPEVVASIVLKAVKQNVYEVFVPTRLFYMFSLAHLLPFKVKLALYKFADCGVGSHH